MATRYSLRNILLVSLLIISCTSAYSSETRELYRIRIINIGYGTISVSADGGNSYFPVGRVTRPAVESIKGYTASIYADPSTVAAIAVHAIRIKISDTRESEEGSRIFSILPREFTKATKGFGGHIAGLSGICTDIPTGTAIFRNLAPFVGNPVYRLVGERMVSLSEGYTPTKGDVFIIVVNIPCRYPREITFENKPGGKVEAAYSDGTDIIARVESPVRGVGRFDATGYTGVGRINTNHTGVLTISTAPIAKGEKDGGPVETRGGFMIQPSRHAKTSVNPAQVLVVAPISKSAPWLEGMPPLFAGYIGLADDPQNVENSFRVDMKAAFSDWIPLTAFVGRKDNAFMNLPSGAGKLTHIRIRFPVISAEWIKSQLERCNREYLETNHYGSAAR